MQLNNQFNQYFQEYRLKGQGFLVKLLLFAVIGLGVVGVFSPYDYNVLPAVAILELAVLLLSISVFPPKSRTAFAFMLMATLYLVVTFSLAIFGNDTHLLDYLQAYKAFFYMALLCCFIGEALLKKEHVVKFFYLLLFLFFVKYFYSRVLGLDAWVSSRPGLFTENNFELIFLLLLFYLVLSDIRWKTISFVIIMLVILLSASRSAFLCFLVIYFFSIFRVGKKYIKQWLLLFPLLILLGVGIVSDRMDISLGGTPSAPVEEPVAPLSDDSTTALPGGSAEQDAEKPLTFRAFLEKGRSVDRVRFLLFFLDDVEDWSWWNVLLGTKPLTPLSVETCDALSYWSDMYSFSGDGRCYSVILHSYIIRVVYDHGVLGLLFLITFTAYALRKSSYSWYDILCVVGVLLASSLSVSAFNSVFAMLSMVFYLSRNQTVIKSSL